MSKQEAVLRTNYWIRVSRKGKQKRWKTSNDMFGRVGWVTGGHQPSPAKKSPGDASGRKGNRPGAAVECRCYRSCDVYFLNSCVWTPLTVCPHVLCLNSCIRMRSAVVMQVGAGSRHSDSI